MENPQEEWPGGLEINLEECFGLTFLENCAHALSIEKSEKFSSEMLSSGFFVVHDSLGSGENHESELSGWKEVVDDLFVLGNFEIKSW